MISTLRTSAAAALLVAGLGLLALPAHAQAQTGEPWPRHRDERGYTYHRERTTRTPQHGYSGFAGPPLQRSYCDYRRIPNRVCHNGRCRVESWTLEQYCY